MRRIAPALIGLAAACLVASTALAAPPSHRHGGNRYDTRFDDGTALDHHGDRVNRLGLRVYPAAHHRHVSHHHGHHDECHHGYHHGYRYGYHHPVIVPSPVIVSPYGYPSVYRSYYYPYRPYCPYYPGGVIRYYRPGVGVSIQW